MAKVVLTTKVSPSYDDRPEERYHFPATYLNQVSAAVGDYVVYYEPRRSSEEESSRGGRQAYFATARVESIIDDTTRPNHFYALISEYLDFDRAVPFAESGHYYETILRKADGTTNRGAFGRAVRAIPDVEFDRILKSGFAAELRQNRDQETRVNNELDEPIRDFERPVIELTTSRLFRDQSFRRVVRTAYNNRCALTGLRLINGGGLPEVQAAHIMPVTSRGPDSVRNGLALSGTVHWMFDRGLLSLADDNRILIAHNRVPEEVCRLLNRDGKAILPRDPILRPHPHYLEFHRSEVFKG